MKISSAFCDLHPLYELAPPKEIATISDAGIDTLKAERCTRTECDRYFYYGFGYFDHVPGEHPKMSETDGKPRCSSHGDFMKLTKINNVPTWACPSDDCLVTKPYGVVGPLMLHPFGRAGDGPNIDNWKDIYQYVVCGLPPGEEAWIARMDGHWSTLRRTNGVQDHWRGEYDGPEEALSILSLKLGQ
jgi:hypothetical protein